MKKSTRWLICLLTAAVLLSALCVSAWMADGSPISLTAPETARPGETITVQVKTEQTGFADGKLAFTYTTAALTFLDASVTEAGWEADADVTLSVNDEQEGRVVLAFAAVEESKIGTVFELRFKAKADAIAVVGVDSEASYVTGLRNADLSAEAVTTIGSASRFRLAGASMTLNNDLTMNFFVQVSDRTGEGWTAEITRVGETVTVPASEWVRSGSLYRIAYAGIAAKEMTDPVTVVIRDADGVPVSEYWNDSVRDYAMRMMGKGMDTLMVDMLNYGTAAQSFFGYATDDPANGLLSESQKAAATQTVEMNDYSEAIRNSAGASLSLESNIELNMFFQISNGSGLKATVTYTDYRGKAVSYETDVEVYDRLCKVVVDTLVVADARQPVTCQVVDAYGNVIAAAVDSVESYCARNAEAVPLCEPLMKFAQSAHDYFLK